MAATVTENLVSKLGELSAEDLLALRELLGVTPQPAPQAQPGKRWDPEANLSPDRTLAKPVRFWNARNPEYRVRIGGRTKAIQFWGGSIQAKTERELTALRNAHYCREGDDLETPRKCPHCQWPCWNSMAADEHIRYQHPTA